MKEIRQPDIDEVGGGFSESDPLMPCPVPSDDDYLDDYPRNPMSPCEADSLDVPIIDISAPKEIQ